MGRAKTCTGTFESQKKGEQTCIQLLGQKSFFHMHGYTSFDAEVKARKTSTFLLVTASSQSESVYIINLIPGAWLQDSNLGMWRWWPQLAWKSLYGNYQMLPVLSTYHQAGWLLGPKHPKTIVSTYHTHQQRHRVKRRDDLEQGVHPQHEQTWGFFRWMSLIYRHKGDELVTLSP